MPVSHAAWVDATPGDRGDDFEDVSGFFDEGVGGSRGDEFVDLALAETVMAWGANSNFQPAFSRASRRPIYGLGGNADNHPSDSNSNNCPSGSRIIAIASVTVPPTTAPPNSSTFSNAPPRSDTENEMCVSPT